MAGLVEIDRITKLLGYYSAGGTVFGNVLGLIFSFLLLFIVQ